MTRNHTWSRSPTPPSSRSKLAVLADDDAALLELPARLRARELEVALFMIGKGVTEETFASGIENKLDIDNGGDAHASPGICVTSAGHLRCRLNGSLRRWDEWPPAPMDAQFGLQRVNGS